ncbi:MAG TPA: hypothetical protein VIX18_01030 [Nitrospirota bacterium]
MNKNLSRIAADLMKSKGGEDLLSRVRGLRDEIRKIVESPDTMFGKIRGLLESLREIIPDEKQRYNAALKALSTTSKISREAIVREINDQLEELKIIEKGLLSGMPGWRDELKVMQTALQEMRDEITKLREEIARLENDEKEILNSMATRQKEIEVIENAIRELFADIGADITALKIKVAAFTSESAASQPIAPVVQAAPQPAPPAAPAAPQPVPPVVQAVPQPVPPAAQAAPQPVPAGDSVKTDVPGGTAAGIEQKIEFHEPPAQPDPRWQKKCSMCGGIMNFQIDVEKWVCYTCAFEEAGTSEVPVSREEKSVQKTAPSAAPPPRAAALQQKCPMCGGQMDFLANEKKWMCYTCANEEAGNGDVPAKSEEYDDDTTAPKPMSTSDLFAEPSAPAIPLTDLSSDEVEDPVKGSIPGSIRRSSPSSKQQPMKKKPCPACRKKMQFYPEDNAWRCPHCYYERRI